MMCDQCTVLLDNIEEISDVVVSNRIIAFRNDTI